VTFKARILGGAFADLALDLQEPKDELLLEDTAGGRLTIHRYVFRYTDQHGVRYYFRWRDNLIRNEGR
jgi:hypothetical protein